MSSRRNIFQEFQLPEASRNRKKVDIDGSRLMEAAKDAPWQKEDAKKPDQSESKYDLRKSLAWDTAFFTSPGVLDPEELFETLNIHDGDNGIKEINGFPSESLAASRIGECIARRSLAWDTAFFTSAGVLNPEELSLVNKGYKTSETLTHVLPRIEEELLKSAESNSTLDSTYSLASLEIDLFDDMRASMQRSSKASNVVKSSSKFQSQTVLPKPHSSKRQETTSKKINPLPPSRRRRSSTHGIVKPAKEAAKSSQQHGTCSREPDQSSSLEPLKAVSLVNPVSSSATKRPSLGANNMKLNNKIRKAISEQNKSKKPCFGDSGSFIPGATASPEPASSRLHGASHDLFRSACGRITSIDKAPNSLRRKNGLAASGSKARTPSRSLFSSNSKLMHSFQLTDLQSTPKSSSKSVSSSMDCQSSESSASVNQSKHLTKSSNTVFNRRVPANNDASQGSGTDSDRPFSWSGGKETSLSCQDIDKLSKGNSSPLPSTVSREEKPSGLRLPSPTIGFFDVEKSSPLTPNGGLKFHSGLQNSSKVRSGANYLYGTAPSRAKFSKFQPPRTSTRTASMKEKKVGSLQTGTKSCRSPKPNCANPQLEGEKTSQEFTISGTFRSSLATTFKAKIDSSCDSSDGYGSKTDGSGSYIKEEDKGNVQHVTQMVKKSCLNHEASSDISYPLENQLLSLNFHDKENLFSFENQVDVLTKQIEATDLDQNLVREF